MPSDFWFRLSTYLSLVFACLCLGYSEYDLLPEVAVFAGVVIALLVVSFLLDRRFELGLGKANLVGLLIGIASALWFALNLANPRREGPMAALEWPNTMPPIVAPLLMVLIPAKLFRPKHIGDWWAMHGVAVTGVALAAAMADDGFFMLFLMAYTITATWSLVLFFYRRSGSLLPPVPNTTVGTPAQILSATFDEQPPKWVLARSFLWLFLAALFAIPLFLLLPKSEDSWSLVKRKYEIGLSSEGGVDLKQTGELKETEEIAFRVNALDVNGQPPGNMPPEQLFRARSFWNYEGTKFYKWASTFPNDLGFVRESKPASASAEQVGEGAVSIQFMPEKNEHTAVFAMPVWFNKTQFALTNRSGAVLSLSSDATPPIIQTSGTLPGYSQIYVPNEQLLSPPIELRADSRILEVQRNLQQLSSEFYRQYGLELLERMVANDELPADAIVSNTANEVTNPDKHELIARAMANHFATSPELTYSTNIIWKDRKIDPIVDFLKNTKTGNCERFASALVLVLRGVGIPAQYVTGYKGWEIDEDGTMVIRRRAAHAWVEVLIRRPPQPGYQFDPGTPPERRNHVWHWLSLDPTGINSQPITPKKSWLEQSANFLTSLFISYNKEKQQKALADMKTLAIIYGPGACAGLVASIAALWWWTHKRRQDLVTDDTVQLQWYRDFVQLAEQHATPVVAGETPREHAERVAGQLEPQGSAAVRAVRFIASKLYRTRYAGQTLTQDELTNIAAALTQIRSAYDAKTKPIPKPAVSLPA